MNQGAKVLRMLLKEHGDQKRLAEKLGVDAAAVSKWLAGEHLPAARYRALIEDEYDVFWRLWDEPAEEPVPDTERAP